MHLGPDEPDFEALRRSVACLGSGRPADVWVAWLLDWFRGA